MAWSHDLDGPLHQALFRDGEVIATPPLGQRSFIEDGLSPNGRYEYQLSIWFKDRIETASASTVTLAHRPVVAGPMHVNEQGLTLALVDEANPQETKYRVTLSRGGDTVATTDWDTSRCRTFEGLQSGEAYGFEVVARNLDGVETEPVVWLNSQMPQAPEVVFTQGRTGTDDPWILGRLEALADIYEVTDRARVWMLSDVNIQTHKEGNNLSWYHAGYGIKYNHFVSSLASLMHELTHGFWDNWDGWPEPCDVMNVYTFRRDVARFMLDFREYEESGGENPWEEWRAYYNYLTTLSGGYTSSGKGDAWDLLAQGKYDELWPYLFHGAEATIVPLVAGKLSLIPPPLQDYFVGFFSEDEESSWAEEIPWFFGLPPQDQYLWAVQGFFHPIFWQAQGLYEPSVERTTIPEPLRTRLRDADRQQLVRFVNTLEDLSCTRSCWPLWDVDYGYWDFYVRDSLRRPSYYLEELSQGIGVELEQTNLDAVKGVLQALMDQLVCGDGSASEVRELIGTTPDISELQRVAFLQMVDVYEANSDGFTCDSWADEV